MNSLFVKTDSRYVDFSTDPEEQALVDAVAKMASQIELHEDAENADQEKTSSLIQEIKDVEVAELIISLEQESVNPARIFFLIAETLASANLEIAWRGLSDVPAALITHIAGTEPMTELCTVAYSIAAAKDSERRWLSFIPADVESPSFWLWQRPDHLAQVDADMISAAGSIIIRERLIGFPAGNMLTLTLKQSGDRSVHSNIHLNQTQIEQLKAYLFALYAGLISGGVNKAVEESYNYAKQRESFGKPINQHQAVALRLANIAVNSEACKAYAEAALAEAASNGHGCTLAGARHICELGNRTVTDALQVAGAHGYVEGLPFKRIYERIRALSSMFELAMQPG